MPLCLRFLQGRLLLLFLFPNILFASTQKFALDHQVTMTWPVDFPLLLTLSGKDNGVSFSSPYMRENVQVLFDSKSDRAKKIKLSLKEVERDWRYSHQGEQGVHCKSTAQGIRCFSFGNGVLANTYSADRFDFVNGRSIAIHFDGFKSKVMAAKYIEQFQFQVNPHQALIQKRSKKRDSR